MASRELYSSVSTPKRKYSWAHDVAVGTINSAVSPIENMVGNNFYDPRVGSKNSAKVMAFWDKAGGVANKGFWSYMSKGAAGKGKGMAAASSVAGELGNTASTQPINSAATEQQKQINYYNKMGSDTKNLDYLIDPANYNNPSPAGLTNSTGTFAQNQVQNQFGNQYSNLGTTPTGPQYMAMGGMLTKYQGNTHEDGGIKLAGDEVENNETSFNMNQQSDFIFSDRVIVPGSKQSFASKSKRIDSKYKLRPNDPYGKKSQELELRNLAMQQEQVKETMLPKKFKNGGMKYAMGGEWDVPNYNYDTDGITRMSPKGIVLSQAETATSTANESMLKPHTFNPPQTTDEFGQYKTNFLPAVAGYAAQAATNIPSMFVKPNIANFSRVKFKPTSLAEARNEARRSRNLGLATARGVGANSNDIGQVMNYLSGTTAALNSQYGNLVNQSLGTENNANSELNMREQLANSEIERYQEDINTREKDSVRNLKQQALSNVGAISAMAGRDFIANQQADAQIAALMAANPDYTYKVVDGKLVPVRRRTK